MQPPMSPSKTRTLEGKCSKAIMPHNPKAEMMAKPEAKPSSPSIRLKALITAKSQNSTIKKSRNRGNWYPNNTPNLPPPRNTSAAANACPPNLSRGRIPRISSINPTTKSRSEGTKNRRHQSKSSPPATLGHGRATATKQAA